MVAGRLQQDSLKHYVYVLSDSRTPDVPFYVGVGAGRRISCHLREAKKGGPSPKCQHIRKILSEGSSMKTTKIFFGVDTFICFDLEQQMIAEYGRQDIGTGSLFNRTNGGGGGTGRRYTTEQRKQRSEQFSKPVVAYTLDCVRVKEYSSLTIAGELTGSRVHDISKCCAGNCKSAGGFIWRRADQPPPTEVWKHALLRPVVATKNGHSQRFDTIAAAAATIGVKPPSVSNTLSGRQKTTKGYTFTYVDI